MFEALESMDRNALNLAARWVGARADGSDDTVRSAILQRVADGVGTQPAAVESLDQLCLQRLAHTLHVDPRSGETAALEERLFGPLLARVAAHTSCIWRIAAAPLMLHARSARSDCAGFLERVFRCVLPSDSAVRILRDAIDAVPRLSAAPSGVEVADHVRGDLLTLAAHPAWIEPTLLLVIAMACADGNFNKDEERYFHAIAERLGVSRDCTQRMRDNVTAAFWSRRARLAPVNTETPAEVKAHSLQAAFDILDGQGALLSLKAQVCEAVGAVLGPSEKTSTASWTFRLTGGLLGRRGDDDSLLRVALFAFLCRVAA